MFRPNPAAFAAILAAAPLTAALAGCGAPHLAAVRSAEHSLLGQDAAVLAHCIGEPLAVYAHGDAATRVYSSAQMRGADGRLRTTPPPSERANSSACVFEITIRSGRIVAVRSDNRAGWGFGSIRHCAAVVERCKDQRSNPFRAPVSPVDTDGDMKL
ncbi:MAG: hypothetical protein HC900_10745 [Methylacidiphilales bacterium]|nr:hypothetical protein [Candidatus Methylacidiphilales bacterium]